MGHTDIAELLEKIAWKKSDISTCKILSDIAVLTNNESLSAAEKITQIDLYAKTVWEENLPTDVLTSIFISILAHDGCSAFFNSESACTTIFDKINTYYQEHDENELDQNQITYLAQQSCISESTHATLLALLRQKVSPERLLHFAFKANSQNIKVLQTIMMHCRDINFMSCEGDGTFSVPILIKAVIRLNVPLLSLLCAMPGIDVNATDSRSNTALHYHAAARISTKMQEVLTILIEKGANIEAVGHLDRTPLHTAVVNNNIYMVEALLALGANPEGADDICSPLLHFAYGFFRENINYPILLALLEAAANPNKLNRDGKSALHLALKELESILRRNKLDYREGCTTAKATRNVTLKVKDLRNCIDILIEFGAEIVHKSPTPFALEMLQEGAWAKRKPAIAAWSALQMIS